MYVSQKVGLLQISHTVAAELLIAGSDDFADAVRLFKLGDGLLAICRTRMLLGTCNGMIIESTSEKRTLSGPLEELAGSMP